MAHRVVQQVSKAVCNHTYNATAACERDPCKLRYISISCVNHSEGQHEKCSEDSRCNEMDMFKQCYSTKIR